jgi:hypothetical protein
VVTLERDERFLDPAKPLVLRAVDDGSKASGFWQDRIGVAALPTKIVMADKNLGAPQKARDAEQYLLTQSTFQEFPDLWTGQRLDQLAKISNANPQQSEYRWGTAELVSWRTEDGVPARGILFKPEGFDPSKKYPMVVYFYEQMTPTLHNYSPPSGRNIIIPSTYVSKGYLVFEPGHSLPRRPAGTERTQDDRARGAVADCEGLCEGRRRGHPGPVLGRLSNHVHHHANQPVQGSDGRGTGGEHVQRLRWHPLGVRQLTHVTVRARPEPHWRHAVGVS